MTTKASHRAKNLAAIGCLEDGYEAQNEVDFEYTAKLALYHLVIRYDYQGNQQTNPTSPYQSSLNIKITIL